MRSSTSPLGCFSYIFVGVLLFWIVMTMMFYNASETVTFTVTGKERIVETSGSGETLSVDSKYLVFTNVETFENTDMLFAGKFNSSDIQGKLFIDSTYTATVYGWRIPLLSMYRNLGNDVTLVTSTRE